MDGGACARMGLLRRLDGAIQEAISFERSRFYADRRPSVNSVRRGASSAFMQCKFG